MVTKERFAVLLKNGSFVRDEDSNTPQIFTTKGEAYRIFGPDADVQPVRCTYEIMVRPKKKKSAAKK